MAEKEQRVPKEEQAELKKRIHALKAKRDEAIGQKDAKKISSLRHGIRSLKQRTRVVAKAVKAEVAAATAAAAAAPKESTPAAS